MRVHMRVQRCSNSGELDVSSRGVPGPGPRDRSPDVRQAHLHEPVASALPTDLRAARTQATAPFRGARARGALPRHSRGASAGGRRQQPPSSQPVAPESQARAAPPSVTGPGGRTAPLLLRCARWAVTAGQGRGRVITAAGAGAAGVSLALLVAF